MSQQYHQQRGYNQRPQRPYRSGKPGNRPNHNYRPRKKRQAAGSELFMTLAVVVVFALAAVATRVSSEALPLIIAFLVLIAASVLAGMLFVAFRRNQKLKAIQLSGVDVMDGFVFEKYVAELLKSQGFANVRLTEKYDLGIDAIADKDGERWGIQIKRNRGKTKAESVRQAVTALNHYQCTRAMVVSNSLFTGAARQLADSNRCVLVDRSVLGEWIVAYQHRS